MLLPKKEPEELTELEIEGSVEDILGVNGFSVMFKNPNPRLIAKLRPQMPIKIKLSLPSNAEKHDLQNIRLTRIEDSIEKLRKQIGSGIKKIYTWREIEAEARKTELKKRKRRWGKKTKGKKRKR